MNVQVEDLGAVKKKLNIEVPADQARSEMEKALVTFQKEARLKGFRPGKAPKSMIKRLFGPQIEQETIQKLVGDALPEIIKPYEEELIASPRLEEAHFNEDEPFRFSVIIEVKPVFELSGYEGLTIEKETVDVTDDMVARRLEELRQSYATTRSLETARPLQLNDLAVIDYKAFKGEEPVEGGERSNFQLEIGSERFNADFEMALLGLSKGEEKEFTVDFPESHYNPKLAGQAIRFQVNLVDIKEKVLPEPNDEFAQEVDADLKTIEDLRAGLKKELADAEAARAEEKVKQQARAKLLDLAEFELPESLVAREIDEMVSSTQFNLRRSGLSMEAVGFTETKLREDYRPEAEKRVKVALMLEKIAKDKAIVATAEDVDGQILKVSRSTGQPPEVIRDIYNKNDMMDSMREGLVMDKALSYVLENAKIETVQPKSEQPAAE